MQNTSIDLREALNKFQFNILTGGNPEVHVFREDRPIHRLTICYLKYKDSYLTSIDIQAESPGITTEYIFIAEAHIPISNKAEFKYKCGISSIEEFKRAISSVGTALLYDWSTYFGEYADVILQASRYI